MHLMRYYIAGAVLLVSAILLFTRLGHNPLWDDEAVTALAAKGVWKTGDTSVVLDHNVVAYRSGLLLKGTKERSTPPLGAYLAALFVGLSDDGSLAPRLPFALLGLASVGLMFFWLNSIKADWSTWAVLGVFIIGNVSFWLYCRQCRYYSPAIFSTIAVAYLYLNWNGRRSQLVLLAIASLILLAANYLNFVALYLCILVDYLIIGRKRKLLGVVDWIIVLLPQILIGGAIVMTWNTLGTGNKEYLTGNTFVQRLQLIWMNLRDINACEYGSGLLLAAAPILFFVTWNSWFIRAPLALVGYVAVISFLSPQVLTPQTELADVRYLAPVIPLCMAIGAMVVMETARLWKGLAIGLAVVTSSVNLLNGAPFVVHPFRSTIFSFVGELSSPPPQPYGPTIQWINEHVKEKESVWVLLDYQTYPLMYHAPKPVYAWQFRGEPPPAFKDLPPIHFMGRAFPDYIVAFGPIALQQLESLRFPPNIRYANVSVIDTYWRDMYRPELFWHTFKPIPVHKERGEAVYIFKLAPVSMPGMELRL